MIDRRLSGSRVYTPESPIRRPLRFLAQLLADARAARMLAWRLFRRDIAAQYRQTAIGYVWAIMPPLFVTLIWVGLNSSKIVAIKTGGTGVPYPVFVLTGTIFWQLFLDAMNAPLRQLSANKSMLNRVNFPTEALLISGFAQVLFSFLIKLVVLAGAMAAFTVPVRWTAVFIVFPIAGLLAIGTVIGLLLAPIGVLYKDIEQGLTVIVSPLMFLTPVLYPPQIGGLIGRIMYANPLTPMFVATRHLLFGGGASYLTEFVLISVVTVALALIGWVIYRLALPILIERLEA